MRPVGTMEDVDLAVHRVGVQMALRDCPRWRRGHRRRLTRRLDAVDRERRFRKLANAGTD